MLRALLVVLLAACAGARAETLNVEVPAELDRDAPIAQAVLAECNIESTVGNAVYAGVKRRFPDAQMLRKRGGTELRLTLLAVRGVGPGPWTPRSIDLRADLVRDGKLVDTNVFHRAAGGSFGRIRGSCEFFARLSTLLGRDVAKWLPSAMARATPADAPALAEPPARPAPNDRTAAESQTAQRLQTLDKLRDQGLATPAEYEQKRAEILKDL